MRHISPEFSHRFTPNFIKGTYASVEHVFDAGDYNLASELAVDGSELKGMSLILSGFPLRGIQMLLDQPHLSDFARICVGYGRWYLDDDDGALDSISSIEKCSTEFTMAKELKELILNPRIIIFVTALFPTLHFDANRTSCNEIAPEIKLGQFVLRNVGTQSPRNYRDSTFGQDISVLIEGLPEEEKPFMTLANVSQWFVQTGLDKVRIPRVIWHHDQDQFLPRAFDNFKFYDVGIVTTSQDHFEISRSTGCFCVSQLVSDPSGKSLPQPCKFGNKDIDILFTGSAFDRFHSEKARFLYNLSTLSTDYKMMFLNEHVPYEEYVDLLARARFLPVINRNCGTPSPRCFEAMASGCMVLYPEMTAYSNFGSRCLPYGKTFVDDIKVHLETLRSQPLGLSHNHYPSKHILEPDFFLLTDAKEKRKERFLKFACFATMIWKRSQTLHNLKIAPQSTKRRFVWLMPGTDVSCFDSHCIKGMLQSQVSGLDPDASWDEKDFNNAAVSCINLSLAFMNETTDKYSDSVKQSYVLINRQNAFVWIDRGLGIFPDSLLLRFNHAHLTLMTHVMDHDLVISDKCLGLFQYVIDHIEKLDFDPVGSDVGLHAHHYADPVFPYMQYLDLVTRYCVQTNLPDIDNTDNLFKIRRYLLAASHAYLGWARFLANDYRGAAKLFEASLSICPENQPTNHLLLDSLLFATTNEKRSIHMSSKIVDCFFDCVNQYPVTLLTRLYHVMPHFVDAEREEELKCALTAWYHMGQTIHESTFKSLIPHVYVASMAPFVEFFPKKLLVQMGRWGKTYQKGRSSFDDFIIKHLVSVHISLLIFLGENYSRNVRLIAWAGPKIKKKLASAVGWKFWPNGVKNKIRMIWKKSIRPYYVVAGSPPIKVSLLRNVRLRIRSGFL